MNNLVDINDYTNRLTEELKTKFGDRLLYVGLQGSYLRGEATLESDIDIMLVLDEIHAKGKITPEEKVKEWKSLGLCAPGDAIGSASDRCRTFKDCHECLREFASYNDEHKKFEFVLDKSFIDEEPVVKKHTL